MGRPKGSKNKKTLEKMGMLIIEEKPKPVKKQIKEYLIENGKISIDDALAKGWTRIRQYINEFRYSGMDISSVKLGKHFTYVLNTNTKVKVKKTNLKKDEPKPTIEEVKNKTEIKSIKKTQKETILEHLKEFGSISPIQARDLYNILNLSQTIKSLKEDGYKISTSNERSFKSQNTKIDRVQTCSIYTLENSNKMIKKYRVNLSIDWAYEFLAPSYVIAYNSEIEARKCADEVANMIVNRLNFIDHSNSNSYVITKFADDEKDAIGVDIFKYATTKKLFKTKTTKTLIATVFITEELVEV